MKRVVICAIALLAVAYVGILVHYHWFTPEGRMMATQQGRDVWAKTLARHPDAVLIDWVGPVRSGKMDAENTRLLCAYRDSLAMDIDGLSEAVEFCERLGNKRDVPRYKVDIQQKREAIESVAAVMSCLERDSCRYCYAKIRTRGDDATRIFVVDDKRMVWRWHGRDECNSFVGYFLR